MSDGAWKSLEAAAIKEGKVVLYSQLPPQLGTRIKADFEKAHPGIVLEQIRSPGSELLAKLETERQSGADGGDVLLTTAMQYLQQRAEDGTVFPPAGPNARAWPSRAYIVNLVPTMSVEPLGAIVYNTRAVKSPPTGYADLLRPELKGKLGITGPLGSQTVIAWFDWLEKTQGGEFLARLAAQSPRVYAGAIPNTQAAASGEVDVTAFSNLAVANGLIEQGAPIKAVVPTASLGFASSAIALKWSKRPNAAQLLVDYLMSRRGQAVWHGGGTSASPLSGIPGSMNFAAITPYDHTKYPQSFVNSYMARWNTIFNVK